MVFDLTDKQAMNKGFGDGMSRAFEFVATPAVFGGIGYLVDSAVGTAPVFTIALVAFALVGMFVRMWYGYDSEMRRHEATARWARGAAGEAETSEASATDVDLWARRRPGPPTRAEAGQ